MKIFKKISIVLILLIGSALIIAKFVPQEVSIEKEITINQPRVVVFQYIKYLENQNDFSTWSKNDPQMTTTSKGEDGTVGFIMTWNSKLNKAKKGEQKITKIIEGKRIEYEVQILEPHKIKGFGYMETSSKSPDQTIVKWGIKGKINYPKNLMFYIFNKKNTIGNDIQDGLVNLKNILEGND